MKKQRFFMLGIITVLVAVLSLTFVSSTFAKYTSTGQAQDSARVAKWGVTVTANATQAVVKEEDGTAAETHVQAGSPQLILAPGTKAITVADFAISGDPEVAINVKYVATVSLENWTVDSAYYCPLVVKVNDTTLEGISYADADAFEAAIAAEIAAQSADYAQDANLSSVKAPIVTVSWPFNVSDANNGKDTALGNAANAATISIVIDCTITQID